MAYTIKSIDEQGGVTVSFDVDDRDQHISGLPVDSAAGLRASLDQYERAYVDGLRIEQGTEVHPDVQNMVQRS